MAPLPLISLTVYKCLVFPLLCVSLLFVSVCLIAVLYFCCCFERSDFLHFIFLDIESFLQRPALWVLSPSTRAAVCDTSSADSRDFCVVHKGVGHTVCCVVGVDLPCVHAAPRTSLDSKSFYKQHISSFSCSAATLKHTGCYF